MTQNVVVSLNSTNFPVQLGPLLKYMLLDICHHGFVNCKDCLGTHQSELVG